MKKETSKNGILDITEGIIAHQVNCCNKIGAGVSKAIISQYPIVEYAYHTYCEGKSKEELFGNYQLVMVTDRLWIANIFSQKDYGNSAKTGQVYTDMEKLTDILKTIIDDTVENVYVPDHIGCGLAGGDWLEFTDIMKDTDILIRERASA